ncbi:hypothetical protein [Haloferax sp. YSSS75]|uniref:hypothetical protein n=1 Tax=Haloferax sp. YSSS75 TaxID=3388564 RepID=UPI00398D14B0
MVLEKYKQNFIKHYSKPKVRRGLKLGFVTIIGLGWVVSQYVTSVLTLEQTVLFALVLLLVSLEIVETKIYDLENLFNEPISAHRDNYDVDDTISGHFDSNYPAKGFIISYSGSTGTSKSPVKQMIQRGTKVHILAKNPAHAINPDETDLILEALKSRYEFDKEYDDIEVRFYSEQASIKGLKTDNLLVMSWYTFAKERGREVMGHENPAVTVNSNKDYEFEILSRFFEDVYFALWNAGQTPIELYESNKCPDALARWVDRQRNTEREDWLRAISGKSYESRQNMFQP